MVGLIYHEKAIRGNHAGLERVYRIRKMKFSDKTTKITANKSRENRALSKEINVKASLASMWKTRYNLADYAVKPLPLGMGI